MAESSTLIALGSASEIEAGVRLIQNDKYLRIIADGIGSAFRRLGSALGFKTAELESIEHGHRSLNEQNFELLVLWRQKQPDIRGAYDTLVGALKEIERLGLATQMTADLTEYL